MRFDLGVGLGVAGMCWVTFPLMHVTTLSNPFRLALAWMEVGRAEMERSG